MFGETQKLLVPTARKELIDKYVLTQGLKDLVDDLLKLPDSKNNRNILVRALRGDYSGFGSVHAAPLMTLHKELGIVKYSDMQKKVEDGNYEHDNPPKKIGNFGYNAKRFVEGATYEKISTMWNLWVLEKKENTNYLQWPPREVLEDVCELLVTPS